MPARFAALPLIRHDSRFKLYWNVGILLSIVVFTFIISYRMVFRSFAANGLYYLLNALYLVDIVLGFRTQVREGHVRIEEAAAVRRHYLRGWFAVDLLAFLPFELIAMALFGGAPRDPGQATVYLALQGLTLVKLLKAVRIFRDIKEAVRLSPSLLRLAGFAWWFFMAVHLIALGWILIGGGEGGRPPFDQYLRAAYWVVTTVATIGYGDYYPNHDSNPQICFTIILQLFGVGMYSFIIANVSSLVANLDQGRAAFQRHLDEVNAFLRAQRVPPELQDRVRDYYSYLWTEKKSLSARGIVEDLPPSLSIEILMHQNADLLRSMDLFREADELFVREAVKALRPRVFLPQEHIVRQGEYGDAMYFVSSGQLEVRVDGAAVATLGPGSLFGEAALVTDERRNASVVAASYGMGYQLAKRDFDELRRRYPEFDQRVGAIVAQRAAINAERARGRRPGDGPA